MVYTQLFAATRSAPPEEVPALVIDQPSSPSPGADSLRARVTRRIAADPTSTALLLAGPTALELWPGVRYLEESEGRVVVEAPLSQLPNGDPASDEPAQVVVRALPPRRTPTAYVSRFAWSGEGVGVTSGRLLLAYAPTAHGSPVTHAVLELESTGADGSARHLSSLAESFLANLARAAESRSHAA